MGFIICSAISLALLAVTAFLISRMMIPVEIPHVAGTSVPARTKIESQ